ncbi:TPA: pentapeptide repeat-containing protein [Salmonella enterica]|uniref:Pentapeptide repeat-containing protein n=1 Tax=Salmonella enterica TaxID=28901 RepID=A0A763UX87_SALER|nr:pentapeptide repeat-containing protein [Salmonella enterica]
MNSADLSKILEEHKVWITSMRESGSRANLCNANLCNADLCGANLPDLTFVILGEKYFISITSGEYVRAGCQNHTVEEWRKYSKQEIAEMDGRKALKFYPRLLDIIDFYIGKGERPDWLTSKEYADEVTE